DYADPYRWRAYAFLEMAHQDSEPAQDFTEAVHSFDLYLEKGRPEADVFRDRGLARAELGNLAGAIEDFSRALEIKPDSKSRAQRGWIYLVLEAPKLAVQDFEEAVKLDPAN